MGNDASSQWPDLPFKAWSGTCNTLLLWLQVVGKVRHRLHAAHQSLVERDI
jgi:hypothetical protein